MPAIGARLSGRSLAPGRARDAATERRVARIVAGVRRGGDDALARYARRFDALDGANRSYPRRNARGRRTRARRRPRRAARRRPQHPCGRQAPGATRLARARRSRRRRRAARRAARPRRLLRPRRTLSAALVVADDGDSGFVCRRAGDCRRRARGLRRLSWQRRVEAR